MEKAHHYDISWQCFECKNITQRRKTDNTPVRSIHTANNHDSDSDQSPMGDTLRQSLNSLENTGSPSTNMKYFADLLDTKLNSIKNQIVTELSATIENKISQSIKQLKKDFLQQFQSVKLDNEKIKKDIHHLDTKILQLEKEQESLQNQLQKLTNKIDCNTTARQENQITHDCSKSIVLYGLEEMFEEDGHCLYSRVIDVFYELYNVDLTGYVEDSHRMGNRGKRRPIYIELLSKRMTKYILQNTSFLNNTGLKLSEYLDENGRKIRKKMHEILYEARKNGRHAVIRNNKLYIDGKTHKLEHEKIDNRNLAQNSDIQNQTFRNQRNTM